MRRTRPVVLVLTGWLLWCSVFSTEAQAATDEKVAESAEEAAPAASRPSKVATAPRAAATSLPFRLGLFYAHAFGQSGELTRQIITKDFSGPQLPSPAVLGLDIGIGAGSHIRYHFAASTQWESQGAYSARGFRFDPVTLGFPILIWQNQDVTIHIEPLVHLVRGEIMFQAQPANGQRISNTSLFRIESGIAGAISAVSHHWFLAIEPISLDFRVFEANNQWVRTGFSQLWWFQITAGHEF